MNLQETEAAAAANATAPRVSLDDIEKSIYEKYFVTAAEALDGQVEMDPDTSDFDDALTTFTLCILVMNNGFIVIGKSAPASAENFDAELGKKFAYEDAIRQLWPLMGYALREKLAALPHP